MADTTTTKEKATIDAIREGPVDLGKGISISAILGEDGRIAIIRFSHPTNNGTCVKMVPIRKKMDWFKSGWETWGLKVEKDRTITLFPSVWCPTHNCHGLIRDGEWKSLNFVISDMSQWAAETRIERALKDAEAYGGGYWGAILALADGYSLVRDMSQGGSWQPGSSHRS